MNDRYLYRAKRTDNGEWVEGTPLFYQDGSMTIYGQKQAQTVGFHIQNNGYCDRNTLCQCTGLRDKNGKLIWENDIVNCFEAECCGKISWNESEAGFYFDVLLEDGTYEEEHIYDYADCMDVIGNIFDNPELLEVG